MYHMTDVLGSVGGVYDLAGTQAASTEYDVFGDMRASSGTPSLFAYTGEQHDPTTRFTHLRARDMVQPNQASNGVWLTDRVPPGYLSGRSGQGRIST